MLFRPVPGNFTFAVYAMDRSNSSSMSTAATPARSAESREWDEGLRILVAEDMPSLQKMLQLLLQKEGHAVVTAETGLEAVELANSQPFDVVLMDLQMPGLSGWDATRAIRKREKESGQHVPIIAITAHALPGDRQLCSEAGLDDYLLKPIDLRDLASAIKRLTSRSHGDSPATAN